jgi:hypothetical protein
MPVISEGLRILVDLYVRRYESENKPVAIFAINIILNYAQVD